MKRMDRDRLLFGKIPFWAKMVFVAIVFLLLLYIKYVVVQESASAAGTMVGRAVGTFQGLTDGRVAGFEAGKEQGLKAEDTEVEVVEAMTETGTLEVLAASVRLTDNRVENEYAVLYSIFGNAVFTVDLTNAQVMMGKNGIVNITIPYPQVDLFIDESKTEKVAEYISNKNQGSTEAGYKAYINSFSQISENAQQRIAEYDTLMEQAKGAAIKQVKMLAENVCGSEKKITVDFK